MKIEETYEIAESDIKYKDKDVVATIKITAGDFKDTVFHFGEINFAEEENPDGTYSIGFNYDIISEELNEAEKRYKNELGTKNTETPDIG